MVSKYYKPRPLIEKDCEVCGGWTIGTKATRFCPPCAKNRKKYVRINSENPVVLKGFCVVCGTSLGLSYRKKYCETCKTIKRIETERNRVRVRVRVRDPEKHHIYNQRYLEKPGKLDKKRARDLERAKKNPDRKKEDKVLYRRRKNQRIFLARMMSEDFNLVQDKIVPVEKVMHEKHCFMCGCSFKSFRQATTTCTAECKKSLRYLRKSNRRREWKLNPVGPKP